MLEQKTQEASTPEIPPHEKTLLEFALAESPTVYYVAELDGEISITFISANIEKITGHEPAELSRDDSFPSGFVHPDDLGIYERSLAELHGAEAVVREYRLRTASGGYRWVRDELSLKASGNTTLVHVVGCMTDITSEKQVESRLRAKDEECERLTRLFHDALESLPGGFSVRDSDTALIMCNREFAELYDEEPQALVGMSQEELFRKALPKIRRVDGELVTCSAEDLCRWCERLHQEPMEFELLNGEWKLLKSHPTTDGGFVTIRTDITKQKMAELALRESERRFRQIVEDHPISGSLVDVASGQLLYESPAAAKMFGDEWPLERPRSAIICYADSDNEALSLERLRAQGEVRDQEVLLTRRDGTTFSVSISSRLIELDGKETSINGYVDLTERKRMEHAFRQNEEFVRRLLDVCPVPVGMTRLSDGKVLYTSPSALELFRTSFEEGMLTLDYYVDLSDRTRFLEEVKKHGAVDNMEIELKRADGSTFWGSVSSRLMEFEGEAATVSTIYDLTERRAVEEEITRQREALHQSEKLSALGSLLASVAHELNNPLSVVVGHALLLKETTTDDGIVERATKIGTAADRCARIVKTFLAMARQQPTEPKAVELNEVIEASLDVTGYALRSSGIKVSLELARNLPTVMGDADQLSQVITNLIINARDALEATDRRRRLKMTTAYRKSSNEVVLKVKDNGPGILTDIRPRIFEPFFTTKDVGAGTGVGLAFCHRIIEAHGGTLELEDTQEVGAAFALRLPASVPAEDEEVDPETEGRATRSVKVLVVDDEVDVAEMLAEILRDDGHRVDVVNSGAAALQLIKREEFDVVLSDLRMPGLDGAGLYDILAAKKPALASRVGFVTGDTLSVRSKEFLESTGRPRIEKPIMPHEVRLLVRRLSARGGTLSAVHEDGGRPRPRPDLGLP